MREILFRGKKWNADNEILHFVYGYLTDYSIIKDKFGNGHVVHQETIGQFIGIKYIKGNNIFEGDMLQFPFDLGQAYVVYDGIRFAVKSEGSEAIDYESSGALQYCEIIGNIHELKKDSV